MKINFDTRHAAKPLPILKEGDTVWMKDRKESATVKKQVHDRSYLVDTQSSTYRRNRVQLNKLRTSEPKQAKETKKDTAIPVVPSKPPEAKQPQVAPFLQTRSGRTIKKPQRLIEQI